MIFESIFLLNLFRDTNVGQIFYKLSQTYGTHTNKNNCLRDEGGLSIHQQCKFRSLARCSRQKQNVVPTFETSYGRREREPGVDESYSL
jgi:hypothetical protein